jgi:hypothetical protein
VGGEIGRERGDALEEVLCSGTEIEDHRLLRSRITEAFAAFVILMVFPGKTTKVVL